MKLYRPAESEYQAKAQKSVMLAGSVICFGIFMAFTVLTVDMLRNGHTVAGCIIAVPSLAALVAGFQFVIARSRYGRDLRRIRRAKAENEKVKAGEGSLEESKSGDLGNE